MDTIEKKGQNPHIPVLLLEVMQQLEPLGEGVYVDATFGAGGYSRAILAENTGSKLIAFDKDLKVKSFAESVTQEYPQQFEFIHDSYDKIGEYLSVRNLKARGIVYDLGVSSMQLDNKERGFSFEGEDALDMRMDQTQPFNAFDVVNGYDEAHLADIIYHYGDERRSRRIAKQIVEYRNLVGEIKTTKELREIVTKVVKRVGKIHPATRTFQAIRIEVNNELNQLKNTILSALPYVEVGGKMIVVTFHSGEDRIVKRIFNDMCSSSNSLVNGGHIDSHAFIQNPNRDEYKEPEFIKLNKKVITPTLAEVEQNIRARSAKLRGIMRVRDDEK